MYQRIDRQFARPGGQRAPRMAKRGPGHHGQRHRAHRSRRQGMRGGGPVDRLAQDRSAQELKAHPLAFLRPLLAEAGIAPLADLKQAKDGALFAGAGLVLVRQRPGTARGVVFVTLEDETGVGNAVVWKQVMERFRKALMGARLMIVKGRVQREGDIIHLVAHRLEDASDRLLLLTEPGTAGNPARRLSPHSPARHPREVRNLVPKSRDFR